HSSLEACIQENGIGFLYTPLFSGGMKHISEARREIGLRTIFNLIGPLSNPADAKAQVLGVYSPDQTEKMARVLDRLGAREAFVVHGEGTFDEISICGPTHMSHLKDNAVTNSVLMPEDFGLERVAPERIKGGNARENARIIENVLDGEKGPKRDLVALNTAAAFVVTGLDADFRQGIERAEDAIDSGRARQKLDAVVAFTQDCRAFVRGEFQP
ncbi:MAG: anthranilate phosphoribosyltransferase, partial [Deltaproteobacteria bacterium]|nr:anthranilate phosphoribosyltransferase [Deltaproteobacteria bacterium]